MRGAFVVVVGLGLSACATMSASGDAARAGAQPLPAEGAVVTDSINNDELICERSFREDSTCPVLGTLSEDEQQSVATFMEENRVQSTQMPTPEQAPAGTMMQATDDAQ